MDKKYALIGFARGIFIVILTAFLSYVGKADNLTFLDPGTATLIAAIALGVEHIIESATGRAFFGAIKA